MSFTDLSPGDGKIRQAWNICSMKVGAVALRECAEDQGETRGEKSIEYDTYVQLQSRSKRSPQGQGWENLLHMPHSPIMCHGRHC